MLQVLQGDWHVWHWKLIATEAESHLYMHWFFCERYCGAAGSVRQEVQLVAVLLQVPQLLLQAVQLKFVSPKNDDGHPG